VTANRTGNGGSGYGGRGIQQGGNGGGGGDGGGIWSGGSLTASGCTFSGNSTGAGGQAGAGEQGGGWGGAIYAVGYLALTNCTLATNSTGSGGGGGESGGGPASGGYGGQGGQGGDGAGIYSQNSHLVNCTVANNSTGAGGMGGSGIAAGGSGGQGGDGAGIYSGNNSDLLNCTVASNWGGSGGLGGVTIYPPFMPPGRAGIGGVANAFGTVRLVNTIVALNAGDTNSPDVSGAFLSLGYNLIGTTNGSSGFLIPGDLIGSLAFPLDPKLGPLANNGGPTPTMALLPGSPAIDAGNTATAPPTDERGFPRPAGAAADIGAFEYGSVMPTIAVSQSGETVNILASGNAGNSCRLLSSTDLSSWIPIATNQLGSDGTFLFSDNFAPGAVCRFYRLVMP